MHFAWFSNTKKKNQRGRSASGALRRKSGGHRTSRFEPLESRQLLSVSPLGSAAPSYKLFTSFGSARPLAGGGSGDYSPAQIEQAYGFNSISFNGVPGDGRGTTIAIVDAYDAPTISSDLQTFDQQFGLPNPTFTKVNENGGSTPPQANSSWAVEIALDVEWAHAIAPKANILLVEAASSSYNDLFKAVSYAAGQSGVVAVSMSWGGSEFTGENSYDSVFQTPGGHSGVTFVVSSGDNGAPASYPATSPNVVAVGGTTLTLNSSNNIGSETAWSGSGGGISAVESQPLYQKGVVTQSTTMRTNPDVAYDADPNTGFPVYDSDGYSWLQVGGTSDAAPQWAALIAIADQGRISAGLGPLNGATQTLPMLYSAPASDFHDITSGSSTGSPPYSAGPAYDLVTGRGTPVANALVAYLAQTTVTPPVPTATHFSVSTSTNSPVAGVPFSVTVTALDGTTIVPGYVGTVQLSSSDPAAGLPASYTFTTGTNGDNGVHTFSVVTLVTAGPQSVTATDIANGTILGSASVAVSPSTAAQLAFGQQPGNATPGGTISPAVTVKLLDAYKNLVSAGTVTLTISSNPGSGTLSGPNVSGGVATANVSGGVATFSNLSINNAGNGYTLVASSGGLQATSANFNITTSTATTIEDFESGNLKRYTTVDGYRPTASVAAAAAHDGNYGLLQTAGNDWIYRNDAAAHVAQGDTISVWMQFPTAPTGRAYFAFGASSAGTLSLVAAPNTNQLILQSNLGFNFTNIAAVPATYQANSWYRLEVDWGTGGAIVGTLFASDGQTPLASVSGTTTVITGGGIGFRSTASYNTYWDTVTMTPIVSISATTSGGTTSTGSSSGPSTGGFPWPGGWGVFLSDPLAALVAQQRAVQSVFASLGQSGAASAAAATPGGAEPVSTVMASLGRLPYGGLPSAW